MSNLSTLPKGDSAWLLRKAIQRIIQQVSVLETNIGSSTTGNSNSGEVIFNDAGVLRGDSGLTFNSTTDTLRAGLLIVPGNTQLATVGILYVGSLGSPKLKVDVAGTGETTIASATITGDLTVDTGVLKVDSLNNRVGVGTATPTSDLDIYRATGSGITSGISLRTAAGAGGDGSFIKWLGGGSNEKIAQIDGVLNGTDVGYLSFLCGNGADAMAEQYRIASSGVFSWYDGAGGTRMTLNSTGLGVGGSPSYKFTVTGSASGFTGSPSIALYDVTVGSPAGSRNWLIGNVAAGNYGELNFCVSAAAGGAPTNVKMTLDSAGNVGVGVTPSAWAAGFKLVQFGPGSAISCNTNASRCDISANYYYDGANKFITASGYATSISQENGNFYFYRSSTTSGGAGSALTFNAPMVLDASGNLLIGKTASNSSVIGAELRPSGAIISTLAASTNADFTLYTYSTGAAAARFYVGMSGTVFATNTTISAISDARLKENVQDIDVGLGAILALKPRKFDWKEGKGKNIKGDRGFIAQEFEQVFPQLVDEWADPSPEGEAPYKSVRQDLIPVLVKAIQELAAEVNALKNA